MKNVLWISLLVCLSVLDASAAILEPSAAVPPAGEIGYYNAVTIKARRDFRKRFAAMEGEKWFDYRNGYAAVFMADSVRYRVEYDHRGDWSGTEKNYQEAKLDRDVRSVVKRVYFDYTISGIREITLPDLSNVPVYIIRIEDERSIKNLCVYEGEIKVLEDYLKIQ